MFTKSYFFPLKVISRDKMKYQIKHSYHRFITHWFIPKEWYLLRCAMRLICKYRAILKYFTCDEAYTFSQKPYQLSKSSSSLRYLGRHLSQKIPYACTQFKKVFGSFLHIDLLHSRSIYCLWHTVFGTNKHAQEKLTLSHCLKVLIIFDKIGKTK